MTATQLLYYLAIGFLIGWFTVTAGMKQKIIRVYSNEQAYLMMIVIAFLWVPCVVVGIAAGLVKLIDGYDNHDF